MLSLENKKLKHLIHSTKAAKIILRKKPIALNAFIRKQKIKTSNPLNKLGKEE